MSKNIGDLTKSACFSKTNKKDAAGTLRDYVNFRTPFYASSSIKPMPNTLFNLKHWARWHPNVIIVNRSGEGLLSAKGFLEALTSPINKPLKEWAKEAPEEEQDFTYLKDLYQHKLITATTGSNQISNELKEELSILRKLMLQRHRQEALEYALQDPLLENFFSGEPKEETYQLPSNTNHLVILPKTPQAYFLPRAVTHSEALALSFKLLTEDSAVKPHRDYVVVNSSEFPLHLVKNSLSLNIQGPTSDAALMHLLIEKLLTTEEKYFDHKPNQPSPLLETVFKKATTAYQALK